MEQNLLDFFKSVKTCLRTCELFQKLKLNLKYIEDRKIKKQSKQANKCKQSIERKIFNEMSIPKSIYNQK